MGKGKSEGINWVSINGLSSPKSAHLMTACPVWAGFGWSGGWGHRAPEPCKRWPAAAAAAARRTGHPMTTPRRAWLPFGRRWSCTAGGLVMGGKNKTCSNTQDCSLNKAHWHKTRRDLPMKTEPKKKVMGMLTIGAAMFRNQLGLMGKNLRKSRKKNRESLFSSTWQQKATYFYYSLPRKMTDKSHSFQL